MRKISLTEIWQKIAKVRVRKSSSADFLPSEKVETGKTSLSDIIQNRTKIKIIGALLILLMVALSYYYIVGTRPKKGAAYELTTTATSCTLTRGTYNILSDTSCDNKDVIIDTAMMVVSGKHTFKSLTITGAGRITHEAVTIDDYYTSSKGIDLTITGNLTLNYGIIDADYKGYRGGNKTVPHLNGYGGTGSSGTLEIAPLAKVVGQGGSNAGCGEMGVVPVLSCVVPMILNTGSFDFGGGGGSAWYSNGAKGADGASGGGRIRLHIGGNLSMTSNSRISANGSPGVAGTCYSGCANEGAGGGAGAGGTIFIAIGGTWATSGSITVARGDTNADAGQINPSGTIGALTINANINADGGTMPGTFYGSHYGGGGGGLVIVQKLLAPTVQKTLSAETRSTVSPNTNFNPYSLQKDDIVRTTLNFGLKAGEAGIFEFKDEWLKTKNLLTNFTCVPQAPFSRTPENQTTDPLVWQADSTVSSVYYNCKVQ